jgi:hypothetical protein
MDRIGLMGRACSGKDTLADYLVKDKEFVKYNFTDPIKDISKIIFSLSDEQLYCSKEIIDERWGLVLV